MRSHLTEDLLKPKYRGSTIPAYGHCYVASEALWWLLDGSWEPWYGYDRDGATHWWLRKPTGIILDPTAVQYTSRGVRPPYNRMARRAAFMTKEPSKRAKVLMKRLRPDISKIKETLNHIV